MEGSHLAYFFAKNGSNDIYKNKWYQNQKSKPHARRAKERTQWCTSTSLVLIEYQSDGAQMHRHNASQLRNMHKENI